MNVALYNENNIQELFSYISGQQRKPLVVRYPDTVEIRQWRRQHIHTCAKSLYSRCWHVTHPMPFANDVMMYKGKIYISTANRQYAAFLPWIECSLLNAIGPTLKEPKSMWPWPEAGLLSGIKFSENNVGKVGIFL